ncbi:MAG: glycosyltransferase [Crocinitomicaceae bacterium]|nr:glycosyltransferase [Crocinitomicaceae bacterium]
MKLVMIVSRFPYPLEKGDKLRAYHQLKELAETHNVCLISISDKTVADEDYLQVKKYCTELHVFNLKKPLIYWNTAKQFFTDKPYQTGYFYQNHIQRKINKVIHDFKPDHIYCQLIRTAEYVKNIQNIPKTIDYMDALAKGMLRRAAISNGIRKKLFNAEAKRLSEYENRIFDYFNHHTIISEQDRRLIQHPSADTIHVIENGIGEEFLDYKSTAEKKYDLVFVGNLNYPPNIECAEFIAKEILPALRKRNLKPTVLISGASPHSRVLALASDQIVIKGWTKDIRSSYCSGKIFVAPLFIGTGLQNKLLEAMALGLPCITTDLVNNALHAEPDKTILIAQNADEFAKKINHLLIDEKDAQLIANGGKSFVEERFNWKKSVEKLNKILGS